MSLDQGGSDGIQNSKAEVWYLKPIAFGPKGKKRDVKIITQNYNGPCSFIAICNILILRGDIEVLPPTRTTVSYELLSQLVGEYLLTSRPDVDVSAALSVMPHTQKGVDLNPLFTGVKAFRPSGTAGDELKLFEQVGVELVHGWLVHPDSGEAEAIVKASDYDSAVNLIADADHIAKGQLVLDDTDIPQAGSSSIASPSLTDEERRKIEDAMLVRRFLDSTQSQLTYHGLFTLAAALSPGSLVALFRNLHLSVLYKPEEDESLYSLVTDHVFFNEASVVWERLEDVDGGWSTFVDSDFIKSSPAGGDFAGQTAEDALRAAEFEMSQFVVSDPADLALAQQMQAEEYSRARQEHEQYLRQREQRRLGRQERQEEEKKEKKCIIM